MKQFTLTAEELELVEPVEVQRLPPAPTLKPIPGPPGPPGEKGEKGDSVVGPPGPPGKDADPTSPELVALLARLIAAEVAKVPPPRNGVDGKPGRKGDKGDTVIGPPGQPGAPGAPGRDADPKVIERMVAEALGRLPKPKDGEPGDKGDPGDDGARGWTPVLELEGVADHEYLRVSDWLGDGDEKPSIGYVTRNGIEDDVRLAIDLKGTAGKRGPRGFDGGGGGTTTIIQESGGGTGDASETLDAIAQGVIHGHRVVRAVEDDHITEADSSDASQAGEVIGISLTSVADGETVKVQFTGEIVEPTWSFVPGPVYFDASGILTQTLPTVGFAQQVGIATTTTSIIVQIGVPIVLG